MHIPDTTPFDKKLFTEVGATMTLPLVRKIVEDVVHKWEQIKNMPEPEIEATLPTIVQDQTTLSSLPKAKTLIQEIQYHLKELGLVGCHMEDMDRGVVLFPALKQGQQGYFRWRLGDSRVEQFYVPEGRKVS